MFRNLVDRNDDILISNSTEIESIKGARGLSSWEPLNNCFHLLTNGVNRYYNFDNIDKKYIFIS